MCIAIVKPVNKSIPSNDILIKCMNNNPHGAGYGFFRNGELNIKKGFLSFYDLKRSLDEDNIQEDEPAFFHFRKASFGGLDIRKTQPFPLSNSTDFMMKKHVIGCRFIFMHNGTVKYTDEEYEPFKERYAYERSISDTMLFGINVWNKVINPYAKNDYSIESLVSKYILKGDKVTKKQIDYCIENNKFAFMNDEGKITLFGRGWKVRDGLVYSNDKYFNDKYESSNLKPVRQCNFCYTKTTNYEYGDDVVYCKNCEKERLNKEPSNSFKCQECGNLFLKSEQSSLIKDICSECEKNNHTCSHCESVFISESSLAYGNEGNEKYCQKCLLQVCY